MKKSILGIIALTLIALPSCAPYNESASKGFEREDMSALPNNFSLLDLGRTLSKGCVDIFDPWLTIFSPPLDETSILSESARLTFPEHPTMLIRDDRVVVYSLRDTDSISAPDFFNVMEDDTLEIPAAVPLIEEGTPSS
jgi:hypothetical protein